MTSFSSDSLTNLFSECVDKIVGFRRQKYQGTPKGRFPELIPSDSSTMKRAFQLCPYSEVKVVILGQDPYYIPGLADGLAFSSNKDNVLPKSLRNIYRELKNDLGIQRERTSLDDWANNGVLLLNTSLTTEAHNPNAHRGLWDPFINKILTKVLEKDTPVVWFLWGSEAQNKMKVFDSNLLDKSNHYMIQCSHPSPLSAHISFFGSKCFSRANKFLTDNNSAAIDWGQNKKKNKS